MWNRTGTWSHCFYNISVNRKLMHDIYARMQNEGRYGIGMVLAFKMIDYTVCLAEEMVSNLVCRKELLNIYCTFTGCMFTALLKISLTRMRIRTEQGSGWMQQYNSLLHRGQNPIISQQKGLHTSVSVYLL